jgi:hypothetical protein
VANYLNMAMKIFIQGQPEDHEQVIIKQVILRNHQGENTLNFVAGESLLVEIHFQARRRVDRPYFWVGIYGQQGLLFGADMLLDGHRPDYIDGSGVISCIFKAVPLLPQMYTIRMGVRAADGRTILTRTKDVAFFNVVGTMSDIGLSGELAELMSWNASLLILPYEWHLPDGQAFTVMINPPMGDQEPV